MVVAVAKALEGGRPSRSSAPRPATHRHRRRVRRGCRARGRRRPAEGPDRDRQAAPGADRRARGSSRSTATSMPRSGSSGDLAEPGRPPGHARELGQPAPARGPEDRGVRGLRRPRPGARRPRDPGRQRRQHQRLLGRASATTRRPASSRRGRGCSASRRPAPRRSCWAGRSTQPETVATAIRIGNPASGHAADGRARRERRRGSKP